MTRRFISPAYHFTAPHSWSLRSITLADQHGNTPDSEQSPSIVRTLVDLDGIEDESQNLATRAGLSSALPTGQILGSDASLDPQLPRDKLGIEAIRFQPAAAYNRTSSTVVRLV